MARLGIGPMILAAAILAVPAIAATTDTTSTTTSPGMSSPATPSPAVTQHPTNMGAGVPASRSATSPGPSAATAPAAPKYTTADGQVRVGKLVGTSVYNDQDQSVGSIDDVLMTHDNKATVAVISVGGFLGMGSKLVSVPFEQLKIEKDRVVMPGATKESLKGMPEYKYTA